MVCTTLDLGNGVRAIVCRSRAPRKRCSCCQQVGATQLCDWKTGDGKTCDKPVCTTCSTKPAPDKDLCRAHATEWGERQVAA